MILRISLLYLIMILQSEVWFIIHCLRLGDLTMVRAVCLTLTSSDHNKIN